MSSIHSPNVCLQPNAPSGNLQRADQHVPDADTAHMPTNCRTRAPVLKQTEADVLLLLEP
jgi:hypothetical protein